MTWIADHWLDVLGWGGSALLVYSLLQASVLRLRVLNALACVVLIIFNAGVAVWPMVAMNSALLAINCFFIVQLLGDRHNESAFDVIEVSPDDAYVHHLLRVHGPDIRKYNPGFIRDHGDAHSAFIVLKGDETVGVVLLREEGGTATVLLDYVTPRYRNFSPGEFVWRRSGMFHERGLTRVVTRPDMVDAYYGRLGFRREGAAWVMDLA